MDFNSIRCCKFHRITSEVVYILETSHCVAGGSLKNCYVGKTLSDLTNFKKTVNQMPAVVQGGHVLQDLRVKKWSPFLGASKLDEKNKAAVDQFCQQVMKLPENVLREEVVTDFFMESSASNEEDAIKSLNGQPTADDGYDVVRESSSNDYSEVGINRGAAERCRIAVDNGNYDEVVLPEATPPPVGSTDQKSRPDPDSSLYASVHKPKVLPNSDRSADDGEYVETWTYSNFDDDPPTSNNNNKGNSSVSSSVLPGPPPPLHPKQRVTAYPPLKEETTLPARVVSSSPSSCSKAPLTSIPPMPQFSAPQLPLPHPLPDDLSSAVAKNPGEIQIVAIGDYKSTSDNVLSFAKGTMATLILQSDSNWWCIRLGTTTGWIPAAYWRMLNSGDCASLTTKGNSPWFVGKLNRNECESLLMEHGKQQDFVVRESDNGNYALSVKHNDRIHHFPIEVTPGKKYNIGKHDFKSVGNIISYYQKNALFHDDAGQIVTLGSPLVIIKH